MYFTMLLYSISQLEPLYNLMIGFRYVSLIAVLTMSYCYEYKVDGPYECGYREFVLPYYTYASVSVYYPIDKDIYAKSPRTVRRLRDGLKTVEGLSNALPGIPKFLFRYGAQLFLNVVENADLHKDFTSGSKKLTPVISSHGLMANRGMHVYNLKELVSFGCIVYALDHTDTSCSYILDRKSNPPKDVFYANYDSKVHNVSHEQYRQDQLKVRLEDINGLLKYIKTNEAHNIPAIDLTKLVMEGHSMGGITALEACYKIPDFKYCISLDPFFAARWQQIEKNDEYVIKQPLCIINTEKFHKFEELVQDFDSEKILYKFFKDCLKVQNNLYKSYNLFLKNTDHYNQIDHCLNDGLTLKLVGKIPFTSDVYAKYKENNKIMVAFLNECGAIPVPCGFKVDQINQ